MTNFLSKLFVKNHEDIKNPTVRTAYGTLAGFVGISVNFLLSIIKFLLGVISNSVAITADALNNLSDAGSSVVTFISFKIAGKPADKDHPFGHARIEYVSSMIVSFVILLVGAGSFMDAFSILIGKTEVEPLEFSTFGIIALGASILLKIWIALFYRKIGIKVESATLKASSVDSFSDAISSTGVLISAIVIKFTDCYLIDAIMGLVVSLLIIYAGIGVLNQTKNSILGEAPVQELIDSVNEIVARYPAVLGIHDLIVHNYGPGHAFASLHAEVDGSENIYSLHDMIDNIERAIGTELNILCCIHLDPIVTDDETVSRLREITKNVVKEIDETVSVHDFRTVIGDTHTNLIFDVVLPFDSKFTEETIVKEIKDKISQIHPTYFCVITVDRG